MLQDFEGVSYHFGILYINGLRAEVNVGQNHSRHSGNKELVPPAEEVYLEPSWIYTMEPFCKKRLKALYHVHKKSSIVEVWLGFKYASEQASSKVQ